MAGSHVRWALTMVLGLVALAALWLGYRQWRQDQAAAGAVPAGPGASPEVVVHVSGAVASPGLHRLPAGARVADAVAAAQPAPDAAAEALNLAQRLADGDKVYVPTRAEVAGGAVPAAALGAHHSPLPEAAQSGGGKSESRSSSPPQRVSLNRATVEELDRIPGISRELAERIVRQRQAVGRFRSPDDLLQVPGVSQALLTRIRPYLTL